MGLGRAIEEFGDGTVAETEPRRFVKIADWCKRDHRHPDGMPDTHPEGEVAAGRVPDDHRPHRVNGVPGGE